MVIKPWIVVIIPLQKSLNGDKTQAATNKKPFKVPTQIGDQMYQVGLAQS